MKTAVVIPVYNEGKDTQAVINKSASYVDLVVVVDDGSCNNKKISLDGLPRNVIIVRHRINLGKGAALRTGCEAAINRGAELLVLMDSDGQHSPADIPRFLNGLQVGEADIVFGSRHVGRDMPLVMMIGNKVLSLCISLLFGIYISDTQSGFRALTAEAYRRIVWESPRYAVETEMIINVARQKLHWAEIDIATIYHDDYKGTTFVDGIRILLNIIMWRLS